MSTTVNVQEAKTRLSELLRSVERGEEVVIARAGREIARLHPVEPLLRRFDRPLFPGIPAADDEVVLAGADADELQKWEIGHADDPLQEPLE